MKQKNCQKASTKTRFMVDGISYGSKTLYEFHLECKKAVEDRLIGEFSIPAVTRKSRYAVYKPIIDGHEFDSLMEARYYIYLLNLKKEGKVLSFKMQVPFELQGKFTKNGRTYRPINYVADFVVNYKDCTHVIDTKGKETVEFKIKRKLFEYKYPKLELRIIQFYPKTGQWLGLDEIKSLKRKEKSVAHRK